MAEGFTPITTQEQFDQAIGERLKRKEAEVRKEYADYDTQKQTITEKESKITELEKTITELNGKISGYEQTIGEKDAKIKGYETDSVKTRIAREMGLSFDAVDLLTGDNEEAIKKSATTLKAFVDSAKGPAPSFEPNGEGSGSGKDAGYKNMIKGLKGEE